MSSFYEILEMTRVCLPYSCLKTEERDDINSAMEITNYTQ